MQQESYRDQLRAELTRRQMVNPRYSMRAFATALGLSPAFLSKLLSGQKNLSVEAAAQVGDRLGFSRAEASQFCHLVQKESARTPRAKALIETQAESPQKGFATVELDHFQIMSDWYHFAILELASCKGFKSDPKFIARKLKIDPETASRAVARLLRIGLLTNENGRLRKAEKFIFTPTDQPSSSLRNFHTQMIEKAKHSIEAQSVEERDVSGMTLSVSADKLPMAKKEIRKFLMRISKLLDSDKADQVYQLNVQLFALSDKVE